MIAVLRDLIIFFISVQIFGNVFLIALSIYGWRCFSGGLGVYGKIALFGFLMTVSSFSGFMIFEAVKNLMRIL